MLYVHLKIGSNNYIEQAEKELGKLFHEPMIFKPIENMPDYYEMVSKRFELGMFKNEIGGEGGIEDIQ